MERQFDILLVGGGPAGLSAAIYAARSGLSVGIMENYAPGGKLMKTYKIDNYPGISSSEGVTLAMNMMEHALSTGAELISTGAQSITKDKQILGEDGNTYTAKAIILATGTVERKLNIPGEERNIGKGVSFCAICDGAFFKDEVITVIGGGNSAIEESLYLTRFASQINILVRNELRADETLQKEANENPKITIIKKVKPVEILDDGKKVNAIKVVNVLTGEESILETAAVFPYVGNDPISGYCKDLGITDEKGYILTDEEMKTSVPGIFAAGDIRKKTIRQVVTAASDGAIAAQSAIHYINHLNK